jgi:hypothetical protein
MVESDRKVKPRETRVDEGLVLQEMTDATTDSSTEVTSDNIKPDEGYDLYGSDDDHSEKKAKALAIVPADSMKKEAEFGKECIEVPVPPPYTPAITEHLKKPFWRNKCLILIAVSTVGTLVILVGVLLAILLSRSHKGGSSPSSSAASQPTGSLPSIPSRTISSPSSSTASPSNPSSTAHIGVASAPISNAALAAITVPQQWSANGTIQVDPVSLVQIFFQDSNLYLCSKTSTSGSDTWDLSNSGTRIAPAGFNTPITVASTRLRMLPMQVFRLECFRQFGRLACRYIPVNLGRAMEKRVAVTKAIYSQAAN